MKIHRVTYGSIYMTTFKGRGITILFPWEKGEPDYRLANTTILGFRIWWR